MRCNEIIMYKTNVADSGSIICYITMTSSYDVTLKQ